MISGKIELNKFVQIRLILDVKYGDDPMSNRFLVTFRCTIFCQKYL